VKKRRRAGTDSRAVHAGKMSDASGSLADPIYQTAPYFFSGTDALDRAATGDPPDAYYGRNGNRNWTAAERKLAALEGAEDAVVFASGMAAITTAFLAHLKPGDHVVATEDLYGGAVTFFREVLEPMGIRFTFLRTEPEPPFEGAIRKETRWIYLESPTNPLVKIVDLARAGEIARRRGLSAVLDGTFASPVLQQPLSLGFDLVLHSATKYLNGHADLMAGFAVGSAAMLEPIRNRRLRTGGIIDPHAAFLLTRGMKTVGLRVRAQSENALRLAELLARSRAVERVHYPGLPSHAGHEAARRQMSAYGAMLAFDVQGGLPKAKEFLSAIELITLATSLGSVETTADLPWLTSHRSFTPEKKRELGIQEGTIRLSVGIEDFDDLREDVERALGG
jgi:cystathionine beta-lyase/cystathionine gamma-synthase